MDLKEMSLEQLIAEVEKLRGDLDTANKNALAEVQKLRDEIVSKDEQLVAAKEEAALTVEINNELSAKIELLSKAAPVEEKEAVSTSKATISGETFAVGNSTYGFSYPKMHHKGNTITAAEVLASEELQKELVAMGSGMIKLLSVDLNK